MPKPGIRACARSGFRSLFHRPKKANARRSAGRRWARCEGPGNSLGSHLTDCLAGSHKNRNLCSVKGNLNSGGTLCARDFSPNAGAGGSNPARVAEILSGAQLTICPSSTVIGGSLAPQPASSGCLPMRHDIAQ